MTVDYERYKRLGCWSSGEAACLLVGIDPDYYVQLINDELYSPEPDSIDFLCAFSREHERQLQRDKARCLIRQNKISEIQTRMRPIEQALERDLLTGIIAPKATQNESNYFVPSVYVTWAASKGFDIPNELQSLILSAMEAPDVEGDSQSKKERDLTKWFRETWEKEGRPTGTDFFDSLKKYVNQPKSPIRAHYTTGPKGAGISWNTGSATNDMTKKNIQSMASKFKRESNQKAVNS
jgi:hypothetical protein